MILVVRYGQRAEPDQALKMSFAALSKRVEREPTYVLAQVLLGLLALEVRRDDYAIQHLDFVATAVAGAGEGYYLAAIAEARASSPSPLRDAATRNYLQASRDAGFDWSPLAKSEEAFGQMRKQGSWRYISSPAR